MSENVNPTAIASFMATYHPDDAVFETYEIPAEDVIEGRPVAEVATLFASADGSLLAAVARIGTGKYVYRQTADEVNYVTAGRMLISSDKDDTEIECVPGSVTRLDKGAVYTKTVTEPYEEVSVMVSDTAVEM